MECRSIEEKLSAYLENQLSSEEKRQVAEHLKTCAKCSLSLNDLKKIVAYTQGLEEIEPPPWLAQKVMARVREEAESKKGILQKLFYPLHVKVPIEVVATIAIVVTTFYVFKTIEPVVKQPGEILSEQVIVSEQEGKIRDESLAFKEEPPEAPMPMERQRLEKEAGVLAGKTEKFRVPALAGDKRIPKETDRALNIELKKSVKERVLREEQVGYYMQDIKKDVVLVLYVREVETASKETEEIIKRLGGKITRAESFEDRWIITSRLNSEKLNELREKLKSIGDIKEKSALYALKGDVVISIEIEKISKELQ